MCFPASHTDQKSYSLPMGLHPDDPDGDGEDDYEDEYDDEDNEEDYNDELPPFEDCFGTDLAMTFDDVQTAGDIATFARHPALVNPGIRIEGHPVIPLPLTPGDAELLKRTCEQGPFSKGDRAIGDKTWKLAFSEFELVNPAWPDFLDNLACELVDKLGIPGVSTEPRELVLCETGSCFQLDGEFEKERNAIATMVICLPSEHEGGDVHLVFGDDKRTFSTAESSAFEMTTMAWFSDVQHEVAVLESGHRLTLTYDFVPLMMLGSHPKAEFWGQQKETVDNMLNELQEDYPDQNIVIYPLDQYYREMSMSLQKLKGRDKTICQLLHDLAPRNGFYLLFGHMTRRENLAEREDLSKEEYEAAPRTKLDRLFTPEGCIIAKNIRIDKSHVSIMEKFKRCAVDSDNSCYDETDDTDGESILYRNMVAVLFRKEALHQILVGPRGFQGSSLDSLISLVVEDAQKHLGDPTTRDATHSFLKAVTESPQCRDIDLSTALKLMHYAFELDHKDVNLKVTKVVAAHRNPGVREDCQYFLCDLLVRQFSENPDIVDWDQCLVEGLVTRGDRLLLYEVLLVVFGDEDISRHVNADLVYREIIQRGTPQLLMKREECSLLRMSRLETLGHYATIFDNALALGLKDDACRFLESCCHDLLSNRPTWPSHERLTSPAAGALLVPVVQSLDKHECPCPPSLKAVFELVLREGVLGDLQPPSKPEGWKRTTIRVCNQWTFPRRCPLCAPLDDFLANKDEEKWTHELNDAERRHVEDVLSSDIMRGHLKFIKERRGLEGTYIVQKTNKQYEDELNFHRGRTSRIKKDLGSLRKAIVSEMLGNDLYQELILLKKPRRTAAAATTGTKRPAEEAADEAGPNRRARRGRQ
ncbi:hypothetical protein C8034_v002831 [Colletotrichum sidae]|uniref:Prolyl 4-hydroxylase alpha subunit Fe(2+) 2OG dioxygenase domain-containing protein n=1 Tax=Colletotrichum sidae TaxID=1347389 RepID=A0A4R8TBP5_9PEZI|nr:hypothetical protein C8034_v002831 [Colletotrichum sidae]